MNPDDHPAPLVGTIESKGPLQGSLRQLMIKRLLRSLWRSKLRVLVVLLLIIAASSLSVSLAEFNRNAAEVYVDFYGQTNLADLVVEAGNWPAPRDNLTAACQDFQTRQASTTLPVKDCETRLTLDGQYLKHTASQDWIKTTFYGFEEGSGTVSKLYFKSGNGRMATAPGEVVIDLHVNMELGLAVGDELTFRLAGNTTSLTVVGIASSPHHLFFIGDTQTLIPEQGTFVVAYLPVAELASFANLSTDMRNQVLIDIQGTPSYDLQDTTTVEGKALRPLKQELGQDLRNHNVTSFQVLDRGGIHSVELLRQDLAGSQQTLPVVTGLLVGISGLVIAISLDRLIRSQEREIGVLRALGLSGEEIRNVYLLAPMFLGMVGTTVGVLLGLKGSSGMTNWYFDYWGVPVVVDNHYPDLLLMIWVLVAGLVILFGIRPALKAARIMPLEVMGQKPNVTPREWLTRFTQRMPVTLGLGLRSTLRKPGRLAMTVFALSLALMIVGGSMLMVVSMEETLTSSLEDAEKWDAQANFLPDQEDEVRNWSAAHPEVGTQWWLAVEGNASNDERRFAVYGLDQLANTDKFGAMHVSRLVKGRLPDHDSTPREALVDQGTAAILEWEVGDEVKVTISGQMATLRIAGISEELTRSLWLYRSELNQIMGEEAANGLYMEGLEPGSAAAIELERIAFVTYHADLVEGMEKAWESQTQAMGIFLGTGGLIGIVVLLNTLLMNLAERDAELATLRVLGASRRSLTELLMVEHAVIGLLGGIGGAVASLLTAAWFTSSFATWSFYFVITIDWLIVLQIILFVLVAALATTIVGIWRIGRMDLVEKVKEFSQ